MYFLPKFYQLNTPYSANKSEQIIIIKVAGDSWKFFHFPISIFPFAVEYALKGQ